MYATRIILVLVLLGTDASIGFSQLLPRRRQATWKAIEPEVRRRAEDFAAKAIADAVTKAFAEIGSELGPYLDLQISLQIFAESQMDPELLKRIDSSTDGDINQAVQKKLFQELAEKGCASVFFAAR